MADADRPADWDVRLLFGGEVDRDGSAIAFGQEYRDPRFVREIELSDELAAQLQANADRLRQINTDPVIGETDPGAFPARIPQVCYLDPGEVRSYDRLAWGSERKAMFDRDEDYDFVFPVQKLDEHGFVCRTDPIMGELEHGWDLSLEDYGLEPIPL